MEQAWGATEAGWPAAPHEFVRQELGLDLGGAYAGRKLPLAFGKASGQLSLNSAQVRRDAEAGLGFVVLKTVIAEDSSGNRSMGAWATTVSRMRVEEIRGDTGRSGWTVTWSGRGWGGDLARYLDFFSRVLGENDEGGPLIIPSIKAHLPGGPDEPFRQAEYRHTTGALLELWRVRRQGPMPLEKDLSPTLAGDRLSRERDSILRWLSEVPALLKLHSEVAAGVKVMNARFDLSFQVEMIRTLLAAPQPPDFLVYANRLFNPNLEVEGRRGAAYGGPDLSARNLQALQQARDEWAPDGRPEISATGDITCGRIALAYGLAGADSCQMHTLFQLPDRVLQAKMRNRTAAALRYLILHPATGLAAWLLHVGHAAGRPVSWRELPAVGRELELPIA